MDNIDKADTMATSSLVNNLVIAEVIVIAQVTVVTMVICSNISLGCTTTHTKRWVCHVSSHDLLVY